MTNREQLAWALGFSEYEDKDVADIIADTEMCGHETQKRKGRQRFTANEQEG